MENIHLKDQGSMRKTLLWVLKKMGVEVWSISNWLTVVWNSILWNLWVLLPEWIFWFLLQAIMWSTPHCIA